MLLVEEMAGVDPEVCRSLTAQETIRKAIVARHGDGEGGVKGGEGRERAKCSRERAYRKWGEGYRQEPNYVGAL